MRYLFKKKLQASSAVEELLFNILNYLDELLARQHKKVMEAILATQQDFGKLMDALVAIKSDVQVQLEQAAKLEDQLQQLQNSTPVEVDLSGALAMATSIRQSLEGSANNVGAATAGANASVNPGNTTSEPTLTSGSPGIPGIATPPPVNEPVGDQPPAGNVVGEAPAPSGTIGDNPPAIDTGQNPAAQDGQPATDTTT